ncbi:fanconi-associated nuclease 1-like protein [Sarcoptes scabiei]|uniref:Fanconi-associated nuclease n=1 Tax=Sarcoptes scabiei TaxID=52283 RepID=A0A132A9Z8_SARSC|nr:fanconi-associated nuclease 1-like protein [Sarcoptes scabiei]
MFREMVIERFTIAAVSAEFHRNWNLFKSIYGIRYRPHWYLRASLIADHHLKNQTLSSKLCLDGLNDCTVKHDHKIELYQRYLKLNRIEKPGECLELCPEYHQIVYKNSILYGDYRRFDGIENQTSKNCFFYTHKNGDEEMISVEELVLRHCIENQSFTKGIHSESSIYRSLFILLCWDIIYSEQIYDSFRYHQQIGPLDLNYDTFYQSRQKSFDDRVIEIENLDDITLSSALQHALDKCSDYRSLYNASVSEEDLIEIAICLNGKRLSKIIHILAKHRNLRKGFPDLLVWNAETKAFKAIEVKGPGDRISTTQSIWLSLLDNIGVDCELCLVKPKRSKNSNSFYQILAYLSIN